MVGGRGNKRKSLDVIEKTYIGILLVIFGGIVLHAPLSVGLSTLFPSHVLLIKSWKEILILIAGLIALYLIHKKGQSKIFRDPIIVAIGAYVALHLLLLLYLPQGLTSSLAGLAIDLRYVLFFGLAYTAMCLYPEYKNSFFKVGLAGALIVLTFAILQEFVLPYDVLKYIGYSSKTIIPYLVVDKNYDFIRINSTLRGPNPLGAYAVIVLTILSAAFVRRKIKSDKMSLCITALLLFGGVVALWVSYSRSALFGLFISVGIVLFAANLRKLSKKVWIAFSVVLIVLACGLFVLRNTEFVSNVLLHENPTSGSSYTSNQGHVNSLKDGFTQMTHQPLGSGIGSTGSASMLGTHAEIIENQYLFTAHEVGWLGLALFMFIYASILLRLWKQRGDWFALGVFASGISIAIICVLLPILADDTVSIIWWGLAAIALFPSKKEHE